jgi:hypothetical protein
LKGFEMKLQDSNAAMTWPSVGRALCAGQRLKMDAVTWAEQHSLPAAAIRILKGTVPAGATTSGNWAEGALGDTRQATAAFLASLQTRSVFARIVADNAITRLPFNRRVGFVSANATGWILGDGKPTPLSRLEVGSGTIAPRKAAAMLAMSDEFALDAGPVVESAFTRALRDGVSRVVDQELFDLLMADTGFTPIASSGADAEDAMLDLHRALAALQPSSESLYWVGNRDLAIRASCLLASGGGLLFENMTPVGGELLGIPFLISNSLDDGQLVLLDAAALAGDLGGDAGMTMRASSVADIEMSDSPANDSSVPTGASMTSLFQTNSVALLTTVAFGVEKLRNAVALVENVGWAGTVTV